jgi:hypothetical protein
MKSMNAAAKEKARRSTMKAYRCIAVLLAASTFALGSTASAFESNSQRNFGSHPAKGQAPGPAMAVEGLPDDATPSPDPSDTYREGLEACGDPADCADNL